MVPTILIVDTDSSNRARWEALLLGKGYRVVAARSGEAAVALCPKLQPDLVLLSNTLSDVPGLEVSRRLKADPRNRLLPVVLITVPDGPSTAAASLDAGVSDFCGSSTIVMPSEALSHIESLLQLKTYIDEQAESVVLSLASSIEARAPFNEGHGGRVSNNAVRFGKSLGLGQGELDTLRIAGLVHDIGKIGVSDAILSKPGSLDPDETAIIELHPVIGEHICAPLKSFRNVLPLIRGHHERMDGTGYPDGLWGGQISLTVQVLQIADICDALTSDRPYRRALSVPSALMILFEEARRGWLQESLVRQFAPIVVGAEGSAALIYRGRSRFMEDGKEVVSSSRGLSSH